MAKDGSVFWSSGKSTAFRQIGGEVNPNSRVAHLIRIARAASLELTQA
jgi:hypothetical protein